MSFLLFTVGCSEDEHLQPNSESPTSENETVTEKGVESVTVGERKIIAQNLQEPWEIAKVNNTFYVSERNGSIVTIDGENQSRKPVKFDKNLANQPEAGLLGIAFPDDFTETETAFAYYSYQEDNEYYQRVVTIEQGNEHWVEQSILIDHIPGGQFHQGGRIEIGPDENLYITTGDATNPELAQDVDSLAGKILRMNPNGSIPEDNPFNNSYVYSYGHRNPQGLAWDSDDRLFATEHGSDAHDEINRIIKGSNYGWPVVEGDESENDMEGPIIHSGTETWAPSGMTYFNNNFYFASLRGEGVRKFDPFEETQHLIVSDVGRVRDLLAVDDGIYVITNNTDGRGIPSENEDVLLFISISQNQLH
ncbi:PQQ-dependent sugar dehydrogenase [Virgibacillus byunsanensis]|uniref:PQQ-dependent sugar dehydrogenase n=1 Tax=Virgibacillus byunsanensis TaxID=570945 RepID=A0ABW3LJ34_9BACI